MARLVPGPGTYFTSTSTVWRGSGAAGRCGSECGCWGGGEGLLFLGHLNPKPQSPIARISDPESPQQAKP